MMILGVDIGGSGIKGAIVDTQSGLLVGERHRIETPQPATPEAMAQTLKQLVNHFDWQGPIGCGFPATIHHGVAFSAANIDASWVNTSVEQLFQQTTERPCFVLNDADAAGIAAAPLSSLGFLYMEPMAAEQGPDAYLAQQGETAQA